MTTTQKPSVRAMKAAADFAKWNGYDDAAIARNRDQHIKAAAIIDAHYADLVAALTEARELIEFFHGKPGWIEYQQSPEMKRIGAALALAQSEGTESALTDQKGGAL